MKTIKLKKECGKFNISAKQMDEFIKNLDKEYEENYNERDILFLARRNSEILTKFANFLTFKEQEVEEYVPETTKEIKENYSPQFIKQILEVLKDKNYRIHATSSAEAIMEKGLRCYSPAKDIAHTSYALIDLSDNEILYELFNRQHRNQKQIMILDADSRDLVKNKDYYTLPIERIKGYIDISTGQVILNPKYKPINHVNDRNAKKENQEIDSTEDFQEFSIERQIECFKFLIKEKSEDTYKHCLEEIYEFLRGVIANYFCKDPLPPCTLFKSLQEVDEFKYFLSQLENEVKKYVKQTQEKELEKGKEKSQQVLSSRNSKFSIDDTDKLF